MLYIQFFFRYNYFDLKCYSHFLLYALEHIWPESKKVVCSWFCLLLKLIVVLQLVFQYSDGLKWILCTQNKCVLFCLNLFLNFRPEWGSHFSVFHNDLDIHVIIFSSSFILQDSKAGRISFTCWFLLHKADDKIFNWIMYV